MSQRKQWMPYVLGALVVTGAAVAVAWTTRRPDPMNFKKQLVALGGWSNIKLERKDDTYVIHAEHPVGDTLYHFEVLVWGARLLSVDVFRAVDFKQGSLLPEVRGGFRFENGSVTENDTTRLPSRDGQHLYHLAEEIAEVARRSF